LASDPTKRVLESALKGELADHVGFDKHDKAANKRENTRSGHRTKGVTTDVGPVEIRLRPSPVGVVRFVVN
jgi:putative transposase